MFTSQQFAQRVLDYIAAGMEEQLAWSTAVDDEFYMFGDIDAMLIEQSDTEIV